ncbi:MAG: acyltransferase family protein [Clostridiales bacterium]|nr:acyltransferase family protein [Clostridiales bacterium]
MTEGITLKTKKSNKKFMVLSAIGIIMVVDAHSWTSLNLFASHIPYNSFFMPMFVFISGYFNKVDPDTDLRTYIFKKFRNLMVPYITFSLLLLVLEQLINLLLRGGSERSLYEEVLFNLFGIIIGTPSSIASPLWFVHSLFLVQIIYAVIKKLLYKRWNSIVMMIIFCILNLFSVFFAKTVDIGGAFYFILSAPLKCMFFILFIELGVIYREKIESKLHSLTAGGNLILIILLMIANVFRMMILPEANNIAFVSLEYMSGFPSPFVATPLISSIIGILLWLTIVDAIGNAFYDNRIINYISENTLWVMSLHVLFFNVLNSILLFINKFIVPLHDFSYSEASWYRWEPIPQFSILYFAFGLTGPLLVKMLFDKVTSFSALRK